MRPYGQQTEARNPGTVDLDTLSTLDLVRLMNAEDARVAVAVAEELPSIASAIDLAAARLAAGGRLVYVGAGTSGRLGVLDAAECPATFGTPPEQVVAVIAGGEPAVTGAVEDAEDDQPAGAAAMAALGVGPADVVVGISASGQTPFVAGALDAARSVGAARIALVGNRPSPIADLADVAIAPVVGPEVLTGSTRLKAGTAQKMVLNMVSTGAMVRLGKTFGNLMVDVSPSSAKLRDRARRIVQQATGVPFEEAVARLDEAGGDVKVAVVAALAGIPPDEARADLQGAGGVVRAALERHASGAPADGG